MCDAVRVIGEREDAKLGNVADYGAMKDKNLGALKGYDNQMFNNKVALNNNARDIDMVGDFAKTSSGVSGIEQRAAGNNSKRTSSGIGDLLSFVGTVGANRAARGGGIFG